MLKCIEGFAGPCKLTYTGTITNESKRMNKIAGELNTRLNFLFLAKRPVLKIHISFKWN